MAAIADLDILIVDDHDTMRTLLSAVLERAGARKLRTATNGQSALSLLADAPADFILVDQVMPGMDGATFVAHVRASDSNTRIIMISGNASASAATGVDAFLEKPVSPRALLEAIERVLRA